jgi:hypothetical protein
MTNYITPNANYDLFSTASYATLDTYLKNDPIVKFKTVLDAVSQMDRARRSGVILEL